MKKTLLTLSMIVLACGLIFTACKKKTTDPTPSDDTAAQTTNGSDDTDYQIESDQATNDAETATSHNSKTQRTTGTNSSLITGATITATVADSNNHQFTIAYDGITTVNNKIKSGNIIVQLSHGHHWNDTGAVLTLTFNAYKVQNTFTGRTLTLNGTHYITNVHGGLVMNLTAGGPTITHNVQSTNMQLTFTDGTTRAWGVSRTHVIAKQSGGYTYTTTGDSTITIGGVSYSNVAAAGTTRNGSAFYSQITTPIVWNTAVCPYMQVSGVRVIGGTDRALTVTYGVDANGTVGVGSTCPYGVMLNWINDAGTSKSVILHYYN